MEASIRVLVANRPRLLRELVLSMLSEQAGISVVGEADDERDVPSLVEQTRPDFLLISMDESRKRPALKPPTPALNRCILRTDILSTRTDGIIRCTRTRAI